MEAWRTSCPRMPVWEDATMNDLVTVVAADDESGRQMVRLTEAGRDRLNRSG
jgi:D-3-phosphoglycerate dehydrogenase